MKLGTLERAGLWIVPLLFCSACVSPTIKHEYELSPGRAYGPSVKTALVLPLNETRQVETGVEQGVPATNKLIVAYLQSMGLSVEQPTVEEFRAVQHAAGNAAYQARLDGGSNSISETIEFAEVVPYLVEALDSEADIVVVPNMVIRTGEYVGGRNVRWDGVKRQERGIGGYTWTGTTSGASLFVVIYDRDGSRIFSGYGGLDLLFQLNVARKRYDLREDRLLDIDNLREGVCVSFHPYFGAEEDC